MIEEWKPIAGYEDYYEVSNLGQVRCVKRRQGARCKILKPRTALQGRADQKTKPEYSFVGLYRNGIGRDFRIHRLVATAFIPNPNNYPIINHIDSNGLNNRMENLEWCNNSHNVLHSYYSEGGRLSSRFKAVVQYDLNGVEIAEHRSIKEAAVSVGGKLKLISQACIRFAQCGRLQQACGFRWSFKNNLAKAS
jgi:hypothetical protein